MGKVKNNVLEGRDGWLFLFQGGQSQFDYLTGLKTVNSDSIENFSINIQTRKKFCEEKNIIYKHVVFPSKPLLKRAYLPSEYKNTVSSLFKKYYLNNLNDEVKKSLFYPLEYLEEIENKYSTFQKYDTHMTDRACFEIADYLLQLIDISIYEYPYIINERELSGDLSYMLGSSDKNQEEIIYLENESNYQVGNRSFLPSNTNEVQITHSFKSKTEFRLLVLADSFFKDVLKYLEPFFRDILYIRSATMQYDIIELYQPDVIFTGNAERYLSNVSSDLESESFLLKLYGKSEYNPSEAYLEALRANLSFGYHKNNYTSWVEKVKKESINSLNLQRYEFNKYIKIIESEQYLKFESLGTDPYFTYFNIDFRENKKYVLVINLISSIDTILQVFYVNNRVKPYIFLEENSIKKVIEKGSNSLYILLDFEFLGTTLRLDPMNAPGVMEIVNMTVEEI